LFSAMLWFCKPHPARRTHHLHLVPARYRDELLFRDYLREHPNVRAGYARLMHDLAVRHRQDREAYSQGKTAFVQEILRRARAWTALGLLVRTPQAVLSAGSAVLFPLTPASNVFVRPHTMPGWLQAFVRLAPVSDIVTAERA
jgi:GrpB protein